MSTLMKLLSLRVPYTCSSFRLPKLYVDKCRLTKFHKRPDVLGSNNHVFVRLASSNSRDEIRKKDTMLYITAGVCIIVGLSYAAVPMYRIFCQATGYGGETVRTADGERIQSMKKVRTRPLQIRFNADTSSSLDWKFKPQQTELIVMPGETALAFYTATNPTNYPVVGISTYNVIPFEAGQYFNKIQCFCFEEQRLNPKEQVDMPVFFYIDPEFDDDPKLENVDEITLSYTFFEAKEGAKLVAPSYARA